MLLEIQTVVTFGEEGVVIESGHQGAPMLTLELGVLRQEGGGSLCDHSSACAFVSFAHLCMVQFN